MESSRLAKEKEKVLKAIINAIEENDSFKQQVKNDADPPYFSDIDEQATFFADQFIENGGEFYFCGNFNVFINNIKLFAEKKNIKTFFCNKNKIKQILKDADLNFSSSIDQNTSIETSITLCDFLVARNGGVLVTATSDNDLKLLSPSNIHIVIANLSQIVKETKDALSLIKESCDPILPPYISIITGPSKTNSIENKFIVGAQGAKHLCLFLINDIF